MAIACIIGATQVNAQSNTTLNDEIDFCNGKKTDFKDAKDFAGQIWNRDRWRRGRPQGRAVRHFAGLLQCLESKDTRKAALALWRAEKRSYGAYRTYRLINHYWGCTTLGGCRFWAIPAYIVDCESGGDYTPDFGLTFGGAYGILKSSWILYGGLQFALQANQGTHIEQDIVAKRIWDDGGYWECA